MKDKIILIFLLLINFGLCQTFEKEIYKTIEESTIKQKQLLRPASPEEYRNWLRGYIEKGGKITHVYDYKMPNFFYVAQDSFDVKPLYGASSICIIVPENINLSISKEGTGHNSIYYMKDYNTNYNYFVPLYIKDKWVKQIISKYIVDPFTVKELDK